MCNLLLMIRNEYTQLQIEYNPLSLAHGYTDYPVPTHITDTLAAVAKSSDCMLNQYTRGFVSSKRKILCNI